MSALTVETAVLQVETWPDTIQASGPLEAWQEVIVSPETGGLRIAELVVDVGDTVRKGQVLARLADASVWAEVRKQEANVAQARVALRKAASDVARARIVDDSGGLSKQQIEQYRVAQETASAALQSAQADLASARLRLRQTQIVAPDDGVVASRSGVLGNVVSAGAEVYRLVRKGRIEWRPELDARQLARVVPGQQARLVLPGGDRVTGQVRLVEPTLSTTTGRGRIHVRLPDDSGARAGMFASGTLKLARRAGNTLPQTAIVQRDGRAYVFVVDADRKVTSTTVKTGRRKGDRVEILAGVDATARIVVSGGAFLSDGATVTLAERPAGRTATRAAATR